MFILSVLKLNVKKFLKAPSESVYECKVSEHSSKIWFHRDKIIKIKKYQNQYILHLT